ncbi:glycosyltransferase [Cognatishimia sp. F0-27]|uniref:glycosyltransferase n=1 Tax=Cognatishimia sp. F0-27 TaxID=2816855 RepID=UPI001D0C701C|nr:glycosyltransferase [Cognatishimia sp. F0-27]MCC1492190.1 hypothetical protein [Cognatishimia sp. F0-27]
MSGISGALRHWYFCVNEAGFEPSWPLVEVAVRSALANTRLEPICLYNGMDDAQVARIEALGARVIRHRSRLEDVLRRGYGDLYDQFSGHWLRVDIPVIETTETHVLYTDIDVMFRSHPEPRRMPRVLAAAPERYRWRWPHFNSGVLVMNVPALRALQPAFDAAITARMAQGWKPPGHDQVSYNGFFRWRHSRLTHGLNWKPYWGDNPEAQIIHFHGPKPAHIHKIKIGQTDGMLPVYQRLWRLSPDGYTRYCAEFERYRGS